MPNALIYRAATTTPTSGVDTEAQGAPVITASNRRTHVRAFLVASVAYFNLSNPASAAYTEAWMSDHDVNAYAQQAKHPPVAANTPTAVKQAPKAARPPSKAPAAAHADANHAAKPHAAPAQARTSHHVGSADSKLQVAAHPKGPRAAHTGTATLH
ncbi:transcriptional regulator [Burkholderia sp. A9]|uniref:transcriptional regulator n=1 Tax=Burkholderia sp. A9 TaxID=1365108 RepID=UPI0009DEA5B2|nr:transcriptional regulator [Burkholderia sp. A9]